MSSSSTVSGESFNIFWNWPGTIVFLVIFLVLIVLSSLLLKHSEIMKKSRAWRFWGVVVVVVACIVVSLSISIGITYFSIIF